MAMMTITPRPVEEHQKALGENQKAMINLLEDFYDEKQRSQQFQLALINLTEDLNAERSTLKQGQNALINILEDIEIEREKVEKTKILLESANKELESFTYSVAHDLRAPLRGMGGFGQILLQDYADRLDPQGQDYLKRIYSASQRMGELIEGLLNLSRLTHSVTHKEKVDLSGLAQEISLELKRSEPERQVEFRIESGLVVWGDKPLLRIAMENLLRNAWKFTSKKAKAMIEVGRTQVENQPTFFIKDNGAGFDMAYADKLFGVFQRLHSVQEFSGTGIGLATVLRIIQRHNGKTWAEGKLGEGATFYFTVWEGV